MTLRREHALLALFSKQKGSQSQANEQQSLHQAYENKLGERERPCNQITTTLVQATDRQHKASLP